MKSIVRRKGGRNKRLEEEKRRKRQERKGDVGSRGSVRMREERRE